MNEKGLLFSAKGNNQMNESTFSILSIKFQGYEKDCLIVLFLHSILITNDLCSFNRMYRLNLCSFTMYVIFY